MKKFCLAVAAIFASLAIVSQSPAGGFGFFGGFHRHVGHVGFFHANTFVVGAPAVSYATFAPAPVALPAPTVTFVQPAPVTLQVQAPAPVVTYTAPAPTVTLAAPQVTYTAVAPSYGTTFGAVGGYGTPFGVGGCANGVCGASIHAAFVPGFRFFHHR